MTNTPWADKLREKYEEMQKFKQKAVGPNPKVVKQMTVEAGNFLDLVDCTKPTLPNE